MRIPVLLPLAITFYVTILNGSNPDTPRFYFDNISDGELLTFPVQIGFEIKGHKVVPAENIVERIGHHHLLLDQDSIVEEVVIPNNKNHIHFGGAETETDLNLSPASYVLTLYIADGLHHSYGEKMNASVETTVN